MGKTKYDFSGWATRNDLKCSDGRIIRKDAFKHHDGQTVPLVWMHQHDGPQNVLGHALLENRAEGVYAYCEFNDTEAGQLAKSLVKHGDVTALSIYANKLKHQGSNVLHGMIREVSLVLAGANPGAFIDSVLSHEDSTDDEAIIYTDENIISHSDEDDEEEIHHSEEKEEKEKEKDMADNNEKTVQDIVDGMTEEQKKVMQLIIGQVVEDLQNEGSEGGDDNMKHNVFENDKNNQGDVLSHSEMEAIISDAKRYGSLKDSVIAHGIEDIEYLFPEDRNVTNTPGLISRDMGWVQKVMKSVHHTPFSRIKSIFANITEEDARAKGYMKGKLKKDEVFALLKRNTSPTTIYKKQKLDRDDVIDITDFDVVAWLKSEMRMMLDEEIARAILVGDGRLSSSDDKINESNIRPIWTDEELYTIKALIEVSASATATDKAKAFIRAAIKARKNYKGSGSPTLYAPEDMVTDCLLIEDTTGRIIYESVEKLATALRVKEIVPVPVMDGLTRTDDDSNTLSLAGLIVNLNDYNVGADKGGAVNMFDDFDIDYNAQKYLIETRCSGALVKPYSAIALEIKTTATTSG